MTLDIALDADPEWDSSSITAVNWAELARSAAIAAIGESAFPALGGGERNIELSVRLAGNDEVQQLNALWRGKDKPTNVLSFPMVDAEELGQAEMPGPELLLGDLILARQQCATEAAEKGISLKDHAAHLMVHGVLHLLGYDHMDDASAADMEAREKRALARMGIADPYGEN